jgi:hypothetical protein
VQYWPLVLDESFACVAVAVAVWLGVAVAVAGWQWVAAEVAAWLLIWLGGSV